MPDVCPGGNKIYSFPGLVSAWCLGVHLWYLLILVHSEVWVTQCRESPTTVSQPHPAWWLLLYSTKTENLQLSSACQHFHFQTCQEWFGGIVTNLPRLSKLQTLLLSVQGDSGVL